MSPPVSCVVACFNYGRFLPLALDSALAQPYPNLEVIVVDDGSTDDTPEVARAYEGRIRYLRKENGGVASAVNAGLAAATGDYVFFLSADDELAPIDRIGPSVEVLESRPEVGLVYADMEVIGPEGELLSPSFTSSYETPPQRGDMLDQLLRFNQISGGTLMVRRSLLRLFHPIPEHVGAEDWYMSFQVALEHEIEYLPTALYRYRRHGGNMNLGRTNRTLLRLDEIRLRQLMLTSGALEQPDRVSLGAITRCLDPMLSTGIPLAEALDVDENARLLGERFRRLGEEAEQKRDLDTAARRYARAFGHDATREELGRLALETVEGARLRAAGMPTIELRSRRLLLFADHLIEHPRLLQAVDCAIAGETDVSVIVQVDTAEELQQLSKLAGDTEAEMVAVTQPLDQLAAVSDILLAARPYAGHLGRLPRAETATELRALLAR